MLTESSQLMCYAHHVATADKEWVEKNIKFSLNKAHSKHPCTLWMLDDPRNYAWVYSLVKAMLVEYDYRYDGLRRGKYASTISMLPSLARIPGSTATVHDINRLPDDFVLAMGKSPECIGPDAVEAYRRFYIVGKNRFASWKTRATPSWYTRGLAEYREHGDIQKVSVL
jgi:hypothetical protein